MSFTLGLSIVFLLLIGYRNHMTLNIRLKAIDVIYTHGAPNILRMFFNNSNYRIMMFDFRKWTFKQFYPELWEYENEKIKTNQTTS